MASEMKPETFGRWDVNAAVSSLQANAKPAPAAPFECAKYVRKAIEAGKNGLVLKHPASNSAKDYGPSLELVGFRAVPDPPTFVMKGDVVVFQNCNGHPDGHMAMFDGESWISDFVQNSIYPALAYKQQATSYTVYRFTVFADGPLRPNLG